MKLANGRNRLINIRGRLMDLSNGCVMGILNVTSDSFYEGCRTEAQEEAIAGRAREIVEQGGGIVDIGAYSSRPNATDVSEQEELRRLAMAIAVVRREFPDIPISVDTFRSRVAATCIEEYGADIINDISGGTMDEQMFSTVARLNAPYILMHIKGTPQTMQQEPRYEDVVKEVLLWLGERVRRLRSMGVNDVIVDPGFGFGKTIEHNYELMRSLNEFEILECPLLVGVSRKSMIYRDNGGTPATSLTGTIALNTFAVLNGADIIRVHDVAEGVETNRVARKLLAQSIQMNTNP